MIGGCHARDLRNGVRLRFAYLILSLVAESLCSRGKNRKAARRDILADLEMEVKFSRTKREYMKVGLGGLEVKELE